MAAEPHGQLLGGLWGFAAAHLRPCCAPRSSALCCGTEPCCCSPGAVPMAEAELTKVQSGATAAAESSV